MTFSLFGRKKKVPEKTNPLIEDIFVDMDHVLVDFDRGFKETFGKEVFAR